MKKQLYHLEQYIRCGDMPLYLILYRNRYGRPAYCAMLCTMKNLRLLLKKRKGFTNPKQYGHIVFNEYTDKPSDELIAMLKSRYYFDLPLSKANDAGVEWERAGV